jgi:RNA polymerase sigma factor (sigma-70 family)
MCDSVETDDGTLLSAFAREGSESAFRSLVERHSGWVYAAAFRQLRDANLAEDATQAVFVLLCQRAKQMKPQQKLSGWLFVTLGYTVKSILRSRRRRERHEKLAAIERPRSYAPPPLADGLDEAVARLSENDRIAILLRFYQGMEFDSVALRLGVSEEAAKKRVTRAIGRLRERLGASVSVESLTAASAFGVPAASAALSAQVSHVALSAAGSGTIPASVAPAMKGAVYLMAVTNAKIAAVFVVAILLMGTGVGIVGRELLMTPAEPNVPAIAPAAPSEMQTFAQIYGLQNNEVIRQVLPPFIPARRDFFRKWNRMEPPLSANRVDQTALLIQWRNGNFQLWGTHWGPAYSANYLITMMLKDVYSQDLEGDTPLDGVNIEGDMIVDAKASDEQVRVALENLIGKTTGVPVTLTYRQVQRPVIVFRGKWQATNLDGTPSNNKQTEQTIKIQGEATDRGSGDFGWAPMDHFAGTLGSFMNKTVVIEASGTPKVVSWEFHYSCDGSEESRRRVCDLFAKQTGLTWTEETRMVRRLFIDHQK